MVIIGRQITNNNNKINNSINNRNKNNISNSKNKK